MFGLLDAFTQWFDSYAGASNLDENHDQSVDWVRCIPFIALHVGCFSVFWVGWSWPAVFVAISLYIVRMFAITGFYHRYFSHRSFKTSRFFQFVFAVIGASAIQRGPLWWASYHRYHHKYSDTEKDIHSPKQSGFWRSHMFWFMGKSNFVTKKELIGDFMRYPELRWLDRFDIVIPIFYAAALITVGDLINTFNPDWGVTGSQLFVWGFVISTIVLFHGTCTTNSLAHKYGTKRYMTGDDSRNNIWIALITLGEGWHNNHHHYPNAVRQGFFWWEIDITYLILRFMSRVGIVWDLKGVPEKTLRSSLVLEKR